MQNIIVIFEASDDRLEGLALAFGLGAVQRGANLRLRHLNPSPDARLAHQSYGTLAPADLLWSQSIAIFLESAPNDRSALTTALQTLTDQGDSAHRWAQIFSEDPSSEATEHIRSTLPATVHQLQQNTSLNSLDPAQMTRLGQEFAEL